VRLKDQRPLGGKAKLEIGFAGAPPVTVTSNEFGVLATAPDHPTGDGLAALEAMVHGKSIEGSWTIRLVDLPTGVTADDVEEIFLLLRCEYAT
jgi:hypothetical protein